MSEKWKCSRVNMSNAWQYMVEECNRSMAYDGGIHKVNITSQVVKFGALSFQSNFVWTPGDDKGFHTHVFLGEATWHNIKDIPARVWIRRDKQVFVGLHREWLRQYYELRQMSYELSGFMFRDIPEMANGRIWSDDEIENQYSRLRDERNGRPFKI